MHPSEALYLMVKSMEESEGVGEMEMHLECETEEVITRATIIVRKKSIFDRVK